VLQLFRLLWHVDTARATVRTHAAASLPVASTRSCSPVSTRSYSPLCCRSSPSAFAHYSPTCILKTVHRPTSTSDVGTCCLALRLPGPAHSPTPTKDGAGSSFPADHAFFDQDDAGVPAARAVTTQHAYWRNTNVRRVRCPHVPTRTASVHRLPSRIGLSHLHSPHCAAAVWAYADHIPALHRYSTRLLSTQLGPHPYSCTLHACAIPTRCRPASIFFNT
jgi:hypothetical protein